MKGGEVESKGKNTQVFSGVIKNVLAAAEQESGINEGALGNSS
jgi:hypothetical protein